MVLESTVICFDNSDYQRNGDYFPSRLSAQKEGTNMICLSKFRGNPENNVGLMTISNNVEVLCTLTTDSGRIYSKLNSIQPKGDLKLITGIRIAHLVLKHRQGKNHKMRLVVFVGSPVTETEDDMQKLAKRLKKEKVSVDIISFGNHENNDVILGSFVNTLNGRDGTGSRLLSVPRGSDFTSALLASPIVQGEDGASGAAMTGETFQLGFDPNEDPELALALRLSMEEQRTRDEVQRRTQLNAQQALPAGNTTQTAANGATATSAQPLVATDTQGVPIPVHIESAMPDFSRMTEEEQIAFAIQMSIQDPDIDAEAGQVPMEEDDGGVNYDDLDSVLRSLPGVDPQPENDKDDDNQMQ